MIDPLTVAATAVAALTGTAVVWRLHTRARQVEQATETLRRELAAARHAANHDPLTGLPNRRAFFRQAARLLADPPAGQVLAVVVDLDDFKRVNDELGHAAGDQVLATVAHRFAAFVHDGSGHPPGHHDPGHHRPGGTGLVARLGGDELAGLLVPEPAGDRGAAAATGTRLAKALGTPMRVAGHHVRVSVSVGVAPVPPGTPLTEALRAADAAMYRAKAHRRAADLLPLPAAAPASPTQDWSTSTMAVPNIDPYQRDPASVAPAGSYRQADPVWVYHTAGWRAGVVENASPQAVTVTYRPPHSRGTGVDTLTAPYLLPREDEDPVLDRPPLGR